ncbi:MAG: PEP-CTERM sorting domain-containing protein [Nitrosospira sp.]
MNKLSKAIIAALVFGGSISTATAGGVITGVTASGPGMGSFDAGLIDPHDHSLDFTKSFDSVNPITLTFTVAHTQGGGSHYSVAEALTNNTGVAWTDFHYSISEPVKGQGVVFTEFNHSTLGGFTLDHAPSSGPRNLNFTGNLADGGTTNASFSLSPFDPGAGKTDTFTVTQVPTVSPIPEPETYAMLLAGLLLMGGIAKRKSIS